MTLLLPAIVAILLVSLPGLAVTLTLGLRGAAALVWAVPTSVAVLAVSGYATAYLPLSWGLVALILGTVAATLLALVIRLVRRTQEWEVSGSDPRNAATYAALAVSLLVIGASVVIVFGRADAFSQTYDAYYHLSLTRYFMDSGEAGPFVPRNYDDPTGGGRVFYPAVWHQLSALTGTLTGATVPVATNAATIAVAAFAWPASTLALARSLTRSRFAIVSTAVLAAGFPSFPMWGLEYGVLYPYVLAVALLGFPVSAMVQLLGLAEGERIHPALLVPLALAALGAAALAHPSSLLLVIVFALALILARIVREGVRMASGEAHTFWRTLALLVVVLAVATPVWNNLTTKAFEWSRLGTIPDVIGRFVFDAPSQGFQPSLLAAAAVVGGIMVIARHPRSFHALFPAIAVLALWVPIASAGNDEVREFFGSGFYTDPLRIAHLMPLGLLPLGLIVADRCGQWLLDHHERRAALLGGAGLALVLAATQSVGAVGQARSNAARFFQVDEESQNVTPDELQMIRDMPEYVSPEDLVLVDARTGGALIYALEGLTPTTAHPGERPSDEEFFLLDYFSRADRRDEVCEVVTDTGVDFVLDFGTNQINMHLDHNPPRGLRALERSDLVELVHEVGETRLYAITGCD